MFSLNINIKMTRAYDSFKCGSLLFFFRFNTIIGLYEGKHVIYVYSRNLIRELS